MVRARRFYNTVDMLMLFQSNALSHIEYTTAGIHFALTSVLRELGGVQTLFFFQLELTEEPALMNFNWARLATLRGTAVL